MKFWPLIILLFAILPLRAQVFTTEADRDLIPVKTDTITPSMIPGIYPQIQNKTYKFDYVDSWIKRKLIWENLFMWNTDKGNIYIDPVIDLSFGKEGDRTLSQNTRGVIVNGQIEDKFTFRTEFYENQAVLPEYVSNRVDSFEIMPGLVRAKPFGDNGFDYGMVFSQFMWQPTDHYAMRFGYDRLHIGEGYRSFVLSDASHAYTFMSHHYTHGNWALTHMIASLRNPDVNGFNHVPRAESGAYQPKWFAMTMANWNPTDFLNISLAENTIFMPWDSTKSTFYPASLVPVPFLRSLLYENNGPHHVINTLLINARILPDIYLYGQFMGDEIRLGKLKEYDGLQGAMQFGIKWEKRYLVLKNFVQFEYNVATDNAYTSDSYWTAMTNMDQPLGHPYGQQFSEWVFRGQIALGRIVGNVHFSQLKGLYLPYGDSYYGIDYDAGDASGIFGPFFEPSTVTHIRGELAYVVNFQTNLQVFGSFAMRNYQSALPVDAVKSTAILFGLRHKIRNRNYDYF
ncbi:MAG: hypothetical protein C0592_11380 [Marinilabiliales bacterium]|nr:MAG: hypothetical protein C0592_11380 [Marinilabiliales bacterium]